MPIESEGKEGVKDGGEGSVGTRRASQEREAVCAIRRIKQDSFASDLG